MRRRKLGGSGVTVGPVILGGNVFGWTADETASFRVLDAFLDAGFDGVDTANIYSNWVSGHRGGESEEVLGRWMKARGARDRIMLATKFGMRMDGRQGLSKANMALALEASLRRLQTDYIDLYQAHADDPDTPLEDTMEGFAALIQTGKIRVAGASNYSGPRLQAALDVSSRMGLPRYEVVQPRYNLMDRDRYEGELETVLRVEGLSAIPYYGLAAGFLTGKYRSETDLSLSTRGGTVRQYLGPRGDRVLKALDETAEARRTSPAAVALAWLLTRPGVSAPIASATTEAQLREFADAATLTLQPEDLARLDQSGTTA